MYHFLHNTETKIGTNPKLRFHHNIYRSGPKHPRHGKQSSCLVTALRESGQKGVHRLAGVCHSSVLGSPCVGVLQVSLVVRLQPLLLDCPLLLQIGHRGHCPAQSTTITTTTRPTTCDRSGNCERLPRVPNNQPSLLLAVVIPRGARAARKQLENVLMPIESSTHPQADAIMRKSIHKSSAPSPLYGALSMEVHCPRT